MTQPPTSPATSPDRAARAEAFYAYAASVPVLAQIGQLAVQLGREQRAAKVGVDPGQVFYNSNHQHAVTWYATAYARQLGGGPKAKRDRWSRFYLNNELARQMRRAVKNELDAQRDAMTLALS